MTNVPSGVAFGSSAVDLRASGQISNATLLTLTNSVVATLIPAPGAGLIIRPKRVQLVLAAGAASSGFAVANAGGFQLVLNSATPNIIAGAVGTMTSLCAPAGATALPAAFFGNGGGVSPSTSNTADFSVSSIASINGAPSSAVPPLGANSALVLRTSAANATVTNNTGAVHTLFYNITYELLPVASA